jgi:predicted O-methyltransferase YrrM
MKIDRIAKFKKEGGDETGHFALTLYELIYEKRPRNVLEIGVNKGFSTNVILSALDDLCNEDKNYKGTLYSIDINDCSTVVTDQELRRNWRFIHAGSNKYFNKFDRSLDVLVIDGGHLYSEVCNDYKNYEPFVKDGGLILVHDTISCAGPLRFWHEGHTINFKYPRVELSWHNGLGIIQVKR